MENYVIGIDNGGTLIKAAVFDLNGKEIAVASRPTAVLNPRPGYTERDMDELWEQNCACVRQVLSDSGINPGAVAAVAVCGHGKGL
jgi:L-xylulokinase